MICPLLNHDPMSGSDIYGSELEFALDSGQFTLKDVLKLFKQGLISNEELEFAKDFIDSPLSVTAVKPRPC